MDSPNVSLMDFSDCLLLNLLRYLDSSSLYHLTKVNKRFETLVLDSCLWKRIDARSDPNSKEKIKYCLERVNKYTTVLCLRGETATIPLLSGMQMDNFPDHLTVLALENQNIDQPIISLNNFPKTLVELSFKNSSIANSSYFFKRTFERMENLKVLLLDGCSLINSSVVMSVSKYPSLEILSFYKCQIENSIPYFSIAAWHGFKKLKVLDVRLSGLGNAFLKSMIRCTNIIAFYFRNIDTSYIFDFKDRQHEVEAEGNKISTPQVNFTILRSYGNEDTLITDRGTAELKRTMPKNEAFTLPDSFLYTDPYGSCSCGYVDNLREEKEKECEETKTKECCVSIDGRRCDIFHTDTLERHRELNKLKDRHCIKEYPVNTDQEESKSKDLKNMVSSSSSHDKPLETRKRPAPETFNDTPSTSKSRRNPEGSRTTTSCSQTESVFFEGVHSCGKGVPFCQTGKKFESQDESLSETRASTSTKTEESRRNGILSPCSISDTETMECVERARAQSTGRAVPLEKRKHSGPEDEEEAKTRRSKKSRWLESSIEISWRDENEKSSSSHDGESDRINAAGSVGDWKEDGTNGFIHSGSDVHGDESGNDEPDNSFGGSRTSYSSLEISTRLDSSNASNDSGAVAPVPSTSGSSKCYTCGKHFHDGEKPSTSQDKSKEGEEDADVQTGEDPPEPSDTPPRNHCIDPNKPTGVGDRNEIDTNNRNIIQICIRGNRDRRRLYVPEVIRMGQEVEFPIVLNAVRMINFALPPDQQNENPGQMPEVEVINVNMNVNKVYNLALKRLSFRGYTRVTDVTLNFIEHLNLELVDLTYTRVTKKGIQEFLRMNPNCRVLHKDFCVCKPNLHF